MAELIPLRRPALVADQDAVEIGDLYRKACSSVIDSVPCLIKAGQQLTAKKRSLDHGQWLPWLKENWDVLGFETPRTAQKLMMIGRKYDASVVYGEIEAIQICRLIWGHTHNDGLRGVRGNGDNEWFTPKEYIEAARFVLGEIDLDPASHELAEATVGAKESFTREEDGLGQEWHGRVWLNPPYGREEIGLFVDKLLAEIGRGHTTAAIMLTHNYTDTEWFQAAAGLADALCFTRGRIKFLDSAGEPANPTQGQAFFYYGQHVEKFHQVFRQFGFIMMPYGQACVAVINAVETGASFAL